MYNIVPPYRASVLSHNENYEKSTDGRGRKLKCEEFPELSTALLYAFGEIGGHDSGGLEAHPRAPVKSSLCYTILPT